MADQYVVSDAPRDVQTIQQIDNSLQFASFTVDVAWSLGCLLRSRLSTFVNPTVINISLANGTLLFHTATKPGITNDNDVWVARKRKTVLRFGTSTWLMHNKLAGDEVAFAAKYGLGPAAGEYAIHGGGWPVRVKGVEGVVAIIVVSGLKQEQDHQIIIQTVRDFLDGSGMAEGLEAEKKKED
ncbi:hypothetical protein MBLNU459_g7523t1 [Dothideomycetes sp. NU459]